MTQNQGVPAKIAAGVHSLLRNDQHGRRTLRWLAERSGVPYSTLQFKLNRAPEKFTTAELIAVADALDVPLYELYVEEDA